MNYGNLLNNDFLKVMPSEFITSLIVMVLICAFSFTVYFKQKKADPLKKPKGIVNIMEMVVEYFDNKTKGDMGYIYLPLAGYFAVLAAYIFLGFFIGMMGIPNFIYVGEDAILNSNKLFASLGNPFTNLAFPLLIGLITWTLMQIVAIRYSRWGYLKQFVSPIPAVGLLTIWAPFISISLRLFGNALAGFALSTLIYTAFKYLFSHFLGLIAVPVVMPLFHAYFDLFSGFIQTLVFVTLTMMNIAQNGPSSEEIAAMSLKVQVEMEKQSR